MAPSAVMTTDLMVVEPASRPQEQRAGRGGQVAGRDGLGGVPGGEGVPFRLVGEQRAQRRGQAGGLPGACVQPGDERLQGGGVAVGEQGGAAGDVELSVGRGGEAVDLVGQGPLVGGAQLRQEVQRAAEEDEVAADGAPAGQPGDGLGGDRLEHRRREVGVRGALVEQRLDVGLGEDAAARGDGVEGCVAGRRARPGRTRRCRSRVAIWSMNAPVPPAQVPFMRCSGVGLR
jgi:hypothetical protein